MKTVPCARYERVHGTVRVQLQGRSRWGGPDCGRRKAWLAWQAALEHRPLKRGFCCRTGADGRLSPLASRLSASGPAEAARLNGALVAGLMCNNTLWAPLQAGLGDTANMRISDHRRQELMQAINAHEPWLRLATVSARRPLAGWLHQLASRAHPLRVRELALLDGRSRADTPGAEQTSVAHRAGLGAWASVRGRTRGVSPRRWG
jgi:hypothetical protein